MLIPILTSNFLDDSKIYQNPNMIGEIPDSNIYTLEDYDPILEDGRQNRGNITVTDIIFNEKGFYNDSIKYPDLQDDIDTEALKMAYQHTEYLYTEKGASFDNLDPSTASSQITIVLNESISIQYNHSKPGSEGYLMYGFRLSPIRVKTISINNESSNPVEELNENQYSVDNNDFLIFDYYDYFQIEENNFTIYVEYEYDISLGNWDLRQISKNNIIRTHEKSFSPRFVNNFTLLGLKWNETSTSVKVPADNLSI